MQLVQEIFVLFEQRNDGNSNWTST